MDGFLYGPALAASRAYTAGAFNPHLYAIGSGANPSFFGDDALRETLRERIRSGDFALLEQTLTLHHELVHMIQFLSTTIGVRCLLTLDEALKAVDDHDRVLILPLASAQKGEPGGQHDTGARFQALVQLYAGEFQCLSGAGSGLPQWPRRHQSMSLQRFSDQTEQSAIEDFSILFPSAPGWLVSGARDRSIAFERSKGRHFDYVDVNAAKLFEAFAVLSEFSLILWLDDELEDPSWADRYLSGLSIEYRCIIRLYLDLFGDEDRYLTPNLAAMIDIALMYDPALLNGSQDEWPKQCTAVSSPVTTFWRICHASKSVMPVRSDDPDDAQRFQDDLCAAADLPPVSALVDRALNRLEVARNALASGGSANNELLGSKAIGAGDLSIPLALHHNMMSLRRSLPIAYFWRILDPEFTQQFFIAHHRSLTFYDLETRSRWDRKPWLWTSASVGSVAIDSGTQRQLDCPLKQGRPYFCDARGDPFGVFCVREERDGTTHVCPFVKFHRKTEISVDVAAQRAFNPD